MSAIQRVVLVTGASGLIGQRVVAALRSDTRPNICIGMDRRPPPVHAPGTFITQSVGAPLDAGVRADLAAVTHLVHLAAEMSWTVGPSSGTWQSRWEDEIVGFDRLLHALPHLRHVVFASSYMVYDPTQDEPTLAPTDHYAWTKCALECLLADSAVSSVAVRMLGIYGPGVDLHINRAVMRIVRAAATGTTVDLYGDGQTRRNHLFVDDAVRALVAASRNEWEGAVDIGGPDALTLAECVALTEAVAGHPLDVRWHDTHRRAPSFVVSNDRIRMLGYAPATALRTGLRRYFEWALTQLDGFGRVSPNARRFR